MHSSNNICPSINVSLMIRQLQLSLDGLGLGIKFLSGDAAVIS